jgi:slit protein 2
MACFLYVAAIFSAVLPVIRADEGFLNDDDDYDYAYSGYLPTEDIKPCASVCHCTSIKSGSNPPITVSCHTDQLSPAILLHGTRSVLLFVKLPSVRILGNNFIYDQQAVKRYRVEYLDLSDNGIVEIQCKAFVGLQYLRVLVLSSNRISKIDKCMFDGLPSLTSIDLSNNNISHITEEAFASLPSLKYL